MTNSIKNRKIEEIFKVERLRDSLARKSQLKKFSNLYKKNLLELTDLNSKRFWDKLVSGQNLEFRSSAIYRDKVRIVSGFLKGKLGNFLDIGVGYGDVEKVLYSAHYRLNLFAIDISTFSVDKLSQELDGVFKRASILKIPFKKSFFDFVVVLDVLEHIPPSKTFRALSEVRRVIKKDGELIISVPLNEGLETMLKSGRNPNGHLRGYTPNILEAELELSGFRIHRKIFLYAFKKQYFLKKLVLSFLPFRIKEPNLLIMIASKK